MIIRYTDRARTDLNMAFAWYEKQRRGLGFDFIDSVEVSVKNILAFPEMYSVCYSNFRRSVIRKFPFSIFYSIEDDKIVIHSIFNNRQDTKKRPQTY